MNKNLIICLLVLLSSVAMSASDVVWYDGATPVTYSLCSGRSLVVNTALDMFKGDIYAVTGNSPKEIENGKADILIYEMDKMSPRTKSKLLKCHVPLDKLQGKSDAFYICVFNHQIMITGSNGRGTAYGLLELSRMAGVSPWIWWGDVKPERKRRLTIDSDFTTLQCPSVEYRGIFLNDEDWSVRPWSYKTFEKGNREGMIGAKTYKEIFKLLLRLRANAIWPGMHTGTIPFFMTPGAKEMADSCGIIVGSSHCEPLLRNNVGEWDVKQRGAYNFITNRDSVLAYWTERLRETSHGDYLYTIGMRGIHDGSMEGVKTMKEKTDGLQAAIDAQRILLAKYLKKDITQVPQVFVPYKEVLEIMENGLRVPDDVTLMWCDDNYGYLTRLSDSLQQKRSGGAGVYYHLSYWGRPHDYLWLTTTQPGLIYSEMKQAYDNNARKLWIVNVHDPKVAAYDLQLFLDMAWNINSVSPTTIDRHLDNWLCSQFGKEAGTRLLPVMTEYYRLCGIRKPEFMGWSQTELDKKKYPRGLSPVQKSDFTPSEINDYLSSYRKLKDAVADIERCISPQLRDAYFAAIKYPVFAAADMSIKLLDSKNAMTAYNEIMSMTDYYNHQLAGGKWENILCASPRDLPVFDSPVDMPTLKDTVQTVKEHSPYYKIINASNYASASTGVQPIQMLGYSMNAVSLPKNGELSYLIDYPANQDASLKIALIPTQPNDKGDIRFSVSIDGGESTIFSIKEPFRSEQWKRNVLSGQAVKEIKVRWTKGLHHVVIKALDNHIVVDQLTIE